MSGSRLLLGSSMTDRMPLSADGVPAILQHERLQALLAARAPRAADLFAEPWPDAKEGQPIGRVSWYAPAGEDPVAFEALSTSQRLAAENALRGRLADLVPLFDDPEAGHLVRAALTLSGSADILWTGDAPVLVNWGIVPAQVGEDQAALARHFAGVWRDLMPGGANPWAARPAPVPPPPPAAVPVAAAIGGAAMAAAPGAAAMQGAGSPPPPPAAPPPEGPEPGWRRPMSALTAILAATAIVLLVAAVGLAAGYYYGWVQLARQVEASAPPARDPNFDADLKRIQEGVNDGLRRRLAQLEAGLRGDICLAPDGPLPAAPLRQGEVAPQMSPIPALPPAPDQQPVQRPQAPPGTPQTPGAGQVTNLADLLEESTVLILAPVTSADGRQGLSTGSGFAIAADLVVTNLHVVDGSTPGNLFVVNRKLGRPVEAEVIARTPNHDFGKPDFAVLKLKEGQLAPLALSPTADRLLPVVAVGFPGFVTGVGDDFQRLLRGEAGAMPAAHFTSGEVSGVQQMQGAPVVIHTAAINRGNSGGPLADRCGRIVGVNTFIRTDRETAYRADYALPSVTLLTFLQQNSIAARNEDGPCTPAAPAPAPVPAPAPAPAPTPAPAPAPPR